MLAERTDDHRRLFEEGREAEFFDSFDELLEKCRYYLAHPEERRAIAAAGRQRCLDDDYSYGARLRQVLAEVERIAGEARGV
jgi:spore maturation protein CgeB